MTDVGYRWEAIAQASKEYIDKLQEQLEHALWDLKREIKDKEEAEKKCKALERENQNHRISYQEGQVALIEKDEQLRRLMGIVATYEDCERKYAASKKKEDGDDQSI